MAALKSCLPILISGSLLGQSLFFIFSFEKEKFSYLFFFVFGVTLDYILDIGILKDVVETLDPTIKLQRVLRFLFYQLSWNQLLGCIHGS